METKIAAWTRGFPVEELFLKLQAAGVPAGPVEDCADIHNDPHLHHRSTFVPMEHPEGGTVTLVGPRFKLGKTPGRLERFSARVGADSQRVLRDFAALDEEEIAELVSSGVLEFS